MKVHAFEDGAACGYIRVRMPFAELRRHGIDATHSVDGDPPHDADIVVGQRVGIPGQTLRWLRARRDHRFVWESDDDLWSIDPENVRAARAYTPAMVDETRHTAAIAHLVTVSTERLADTLRPINPNVVVVPNVIEDALLDLERPHRDRLVIGWAGGDSHHRDLDMLAPHLGRFLRRHEDIELHTIGWGSARPPSEFPAHLRQYVRANPLHALGHPYRHTGWSVDLWDYYRQIDFDIALAPLVHSAFNAAKSPIKALEAAALGIPIVASDVGPYREFVRHGVTGFLVRQEHEWDRYLRMLVEDDAMRAEMGAAAKTEAARWTIGSNWTTWADAYRSVL